MPELPEVETVRRQLAAVWTGRTVSRVLTGKHSYFFLTTPLVLRRRLLGRTLLKLHRHGKYLIAEFAQQERLLLHLGMTGQLVARALAPDPHVHLVLELDQGRAISFRDVRKFGKVEWLGRGQGSGRLAKLGPDALTADPALVSRALGTRRVAIKTALLDQKLWAGVGNIYADEALYAAGVRPTLPAHRVGPSRGEQLVRATQAILLRAVEHGGSSINDYIQPEGELGGFQNWHQVYGKAGKPCPTCGKPIVRVILAARSTHFCPTCQK